jgi:cysteine-rich repeat protein
VLDPGEECDDGNIVSGDGCSGLCTSEIGQCERCGLCGNGIFNLCDERECKNLGPCDFQDNWIVNQCVPKAVCFPPPSPTPGSSSAASQTSAGSAGSPQSSSQSLGSSMSPPTSSEESSDVAGSRSSASSSSSPPSEEFFSSAGALIDPFLCSNSALDPNEQCDDGNTVSGDGCSSECQLETGRALVCGDGILTANEQCDDRNVRNGDGCSAGCLTEPTLIVSEPLSSAPSPAPSRSFSSSPISAAAPPSPALVAGFCGNSILDIGEECEDGGTADDNGCSSHCTFRVGYLPNVGDGIIDTGEECDDGNVRDEDGCNAQGLLENGSCGDGKVELLLGEQCERAMHDTALPYECGSDCRFLSPFCGNGRLDAGEQCDDGTRNSSRLADHCRENCSTFRCGDSVLDAAELCDDGNRLPGDGCDRYCRLETRVASRVVDFLTGGEPLGGELPLQGGASTAAESAPAPVPPSVAAALRQISTGHPAAGQTGPAALAVLAAGAAAGYAYVRRKR